MEDKLKVLVVLPVDDNQRSRLEQQGNEYIFDYVAKKDLTDSDVTDADIIIGNVPPKMIHASPKLKLFQLNSAGANEYIIPGILSKDTILANATGAYSKMVAEHGGQHGAIRCFVLPFYLCSSNRCLRTGTSSGRFTALDAG